jgi:hypothetical protein
MGHILAKGCSLHTTSDLWTNSHKLGSPGQITWSLISLFVNKHVVVKDEFKTTCG